MVPDKNVRLYHILIEELLKLFNCNNELYSCSLGGFILKETHNSWEFWNCPNEVRDDCPAFLTYYGMDCFNFAENYCPRMKSDFQHCREFPWYKKLELNFDAKEIKL
jgi:hypothetical protein